MNVFGRAKKCFDLNYVQYQNQRHKSKISCDPPEVQQRLDLHPKVPQHITLIPTVTTKKNVFEWKRGFDKLDKKGHNLAYDFSDIKSSTLSERAAIKEATRCLKCADAPCQKSCPTQVDIKSFIGSIANKNYYGAAKTIFSDSPFGTSCGMICPSCSLCAGSCNLDATEEGPIKIRGLEHFATEVFSKMGIQQTIDPCIPVPDKPDRQICIVGGGPSSLTCATYLARLGYTNIHVYEKEEFLGGLCASEIPHFRLSMSAVNFEISMVRDLGVQVHCNCPLHTEGITIEKLLSEGACAIYLAIGLPQPRLLPMFKGLTANMGFYTSKSFMPLATKASKWGLCGKKAMAKNIPRLHGTVVVLGGGDTAFHCATTALRCGAKKVFVAFRDQMCNLHAVPEEVAMAVEEKCELIGFASPHKVHLENGKMSSITFARSTQQDDGKWIIDDKQLTTIPADFVITAYGSWLEDENMIKALNPLKLDKGNRPVVDPNTLQTSVENVFSGGDVTGLSGTVVDAINDGKAAAWHIHCLLQELPFETKCKLPRFHTNIDEVDISVELCGLKFENPFGLASSPSSNSAPMIRRAFEQGWSFAVTKTFTSNPHSAWNPQIERTERSGYNLGPHQKAFFNVQVSSDKSVDYWCEALVELKKDFPEKIIIASISCPHAVEDWTELSKKVEASCADALELNMSWVECETDSGKPSIIGENPEYVQEIVSWVRKSVKIPIFVKLTPNVTNIEQFAIAAKNGGADGVTVMNTLMGMIDMKPEGQTKNAQTELRCSTIFGGLSGSSMRPIALAAVASISKAVPNFPILGTGGVESAQTALQFIRAGATLVQVSGAIHNQDYTIIEDFCTGLKALLYLSVRLPDWHGQSPPQFKQQKGKKVHTLCNNAGEFIPHFGLYQKEREKQMTELHVNSAGELLSADHTTVPDPPPLTKDLQIPKINDIIGSGLKEVLPHSEIEKREQLVALVDNDICINCGKCYMACNDSGYQAIEFDKKTHLPTITDNCVGCGMCRSVCPIIDCIKLVPKK
ncbi:dihydropyrimidine dehydrogenase [NADP(+)]-like isoform X2 [Atheta coriaria]|uniref:dihydropyrimidine dehydrogenase [NADP(+)]-like isoform X2 n=1 Tax=Dalotia coriaria TaxID=877792 RepID=UPI0031F3F56E